MRRRIPNPVWAALLAGAMTGLCFAQRQYEATELPNPGDGVNYVIWVGEDGSMAGTLTLRPVNSLLAPSGTRCYIYADKKFTIFDTPEATCYANAGNSQGEFAGALFPSVGQTPMNGNLAPTTAFVFREGRFVPLAPALPDSRTLLNSAATSINERGDVIGNLTWQDRTQGVYAIDGWIHSGGKLRILPELGGHHTRPWAINEDGDIVGDSLTQNLEQHAILITHAGELIDLGTLGGPSATAADINSRGQIVGSSLIANDPNSLRLAFFYSAGSMMPIHVEGTTKGTNAGSINNAGEVVGNFYVKDDKGLDVSRAFYFHNGKAIDLNRLVVDRPAGLHLVYPTEIYDDGSIIVFGAYENESATRTFLLTPLEEGTNSPPHPRRRWR